MSDTHTTKDVIDILMTMKEEKAGDSARLQAMHEDIVGINTRLDSQNGRIGKIEKKQWVIWGGIVTAVGVAKLLIG